MHDNDNDHGDSIGLQEKEEKMDINEGDSNESQYEEDNDEEGRFRG